MRQDSSKTFLPSQTQSQVTHFTSNNALHQEMCVPNMEYKLPVTTSSSIQDLCRIVKVNLVQRNTTQSRNQQCDMPHPRPQYRSFFIYFIIHPVNQPHHKQVGGQIDGQCAAVAKLCILQSSQVRRRRRNLHFRKRCTHSIHLLFPTKAKQPLCAMSSNSSSLLLTQLSTFIRKSTSQNQEAATTTHT